MREEEFVKYIKRRTLTWYIPLSEDLVSMGLIEYPSEK